VTKSTRTVLLVVAGLFGFGCLGSALVVAVLTHALGSLGGSGEWSEDAVAERELPSTFGVRLPVKPLRYQSRQLGFQDAYFEVLVRLPPTAAEPFLSSNHLVRGAVESPDPDLVDQLRTLDPGVPALQGTTLQLPEAMKPDGGTWNLHRSGELLEAEGVLWLHLVAFET
jgi:hypothetical protein